MNIPLSGFILFVFLIPGIVYRRLYYSEEFSKQFFKVSLFAVFISTILPSLLFQTIWYFGCQFFGYEVKIELFGNLISTKPNSAIFENLEEYAAPIVFYHVSMIAIAAFSGFFLRKIIRYYKLDRKWKILRFQNKWHYILKGEFYDFPRANVNLENDDVDNIEFVFVDALIETSDCTYIFDGFLVDYELSSDGGLETITLAEVERRKLSDDILVSSDNDDTRSPYYDIEGHILLIKYSETKNLNFTYYTLELNESNEYTPRKIS